MIIKVQDIHNAHKVHVFMVGENSAMKYNQEICGNFEYTTWAIVPNDGSFGYEQERLQAVKQWQKSRKTIFGRIRVVRLKDHDTPCMVYMTVRKQYGRGFEYLTATYWCATEAGEIEGYDLTGNEIAWLRSWEDIMVEHEAKIKQVA